MEILFQKKYCSAKCSSGHEECSFDNSAESWWLEVRIRFYNFDVSKKVETENVHVDSRKWVLPYQFLSKIVLTVKIGGLLAP